jgi:hypothetical protein
MAKVTSVRYVPRWTWQASTLRAWDVHEFGATARTRRRSPLVHRLVICRSLRKALLETELLHDI